MRLIGQIKKNKTSIRAGRDIFAGIMVALVSIPISMGYAQIAGLPAVYGLYGSVLPILVFGLMTTSPQFIVGVDAMPAVMVGSLLAAMGITAESEEALNLVPLVSLLVGIWFVIFYFLKAGRIVKYISTPVMGGFISGVGLTIILMQIPKLFGGNAGTGTLVPLLYHLAEEMPKFHPMSFILGVSTIAVILICKKIIPAIPMTVVMLVAGALLQLFFRIDTYGVKLLPNAAPGLPVPMLPQIRAADGFWAEILLEAFSIALVVMAQTLLASGNYAMKYGDELDSNAELLAYAGMNLASGFFGCAPINGSVSRSGIADSLRGRSQLMSIAASVTMILILLFGTPLLCYLPVPILTGIVITALIGILEINLSKRLWKTGKNEWLVFMISFFGVLLFGTINGVMIGCVLSFFEVSIRAANPPRSFIGRIPGQSNYYALERNKNASPIKYAVIYRFAGNLFFANIDRFEQDIKDAVKPDTRCIIVDARGIGSVDITAADRLVALAKGFWAQDIRFYLTEHDGSLNDMLIKLGGEYLLKHGMVRRTISLALRDAGFEKPYELEHACEEETVLCADVENSDERLAEMEWAFGKDAESWLEQLAEEAAESLIADGEASENDLNLNDETEKEAGPVHTRWGTLGRFDENAFWDFMELHLEQLHKEGKLNDEVLQRLEARIEKRRLQGENRLRRISPHAIPLLHEHQKKLRQHLHHDEPEEFEHMMQVQEKAFEDLKNQNPELAEQIKELHDL